MRSSSAGRSNRCDILEKCHSFPLFKIRPHRHFFRISYRDPNNVAEAVVLGAEAHAADLAGAGADAEPVGADDKLSSGVVTLQELSQTHNRSSPTVTRMHS